MQSRKTYQILEGHLLEIKRIREKAFYDVNILIAHEYPSLNHGDIRIRSFTKFIYILSGLLVGMIPLARNRYELNDWELIYLPKRYDGDDETFLAKSELFLKLGFVTNLFSITESTLRVYADYLLDVEQKKDNKQISNLIKVFLLEKLNFDKYSNNIKALDLLRNIRNSIHNNGFFESLNKNKEPVIISYWDKDYIFKVGEANKLPWDLLFQIADDLEGLLFQIARNPKILLIKDEMIDPFYLLENL